MTAIRGPRAFWRRPGSFPFIRNWGDVQKIAQVCGITVQAVSQWKRVPDRHLFTVAQLLGLSPWQLRPDLTVRNLTMTDMDPRDARLAEDTIQAAASQMEARRLAVLTAQADRQRRAAAKAQAELDLAQADADLRRARQALSRARQTFVNAGIPEDRLNPAQGDRLSPPLLAQSAEGIGGV